MEPELLLPPVADCVPSTTLAEVWNVEFPGILRSAGNGEVADAIDAQGSLGVQPGGSVEVADRRLFFSAPPERAFVFAGRRMRSLS
jgi:hypothetical protein